MITPAEATQNLPIREKGPADRRTDSPADDRKFKDELSQAGSGKKNDAVATDTAGHSSKANLSPNMPNLDPALSVTLLEAAVDAVTKKIDGEPKTESPERKGRKVEPETEVDGTQAVDPKSNISLPIIYPHAPLKIDTNAHPKAAPISPLPDRSDEARASLTLMLDRPKQSAPEVQTSKAPDAPEPEVTISGLEFKSFHAPALDTTSSAEPIDQVEGAQRPVHRQESGPLRTLEVNLNLDNASIDKARVHIRSREDNVEVRIATTDHRLNEAIKNDTAELKQTLQSIGVAVEDVKVSYFGKPRVEDSSGSGNFQQSDSQSQRERMGQEPQDRREGRTTFARDNGEQHERRPENSRSDSPRGDAIYI